MIIDVLTNGVALSVPRILVETIVDAAKDAGVCNIVGNDPQIGIVEHDTRSKRMPLGYRMPASAVGSF